MATLQIGSALKADPPGAVIKIARAQGLHSRSPERRGQLIGNREAGRFREGGQYAIGGGNYRAAMTGAENARHP
jgi:hypothetical protein